MARSRSMAPNAVVSAARPWGERRFASAGKAPSPGSEFHAWARNAASSATAATCSMRTGRVLGWTSAPGRAWARIAAAARTSRPLRPMKNEAAASRTARRTGSSGTVMTAGSKLASTGAAMVSSRANRASSSARASSQRRDRVSSRTVGDTDWLVRHHPTCSSSVLVWAVATAARTDSAHPARRSSSSCIPCSVDSTNPKKAPRSLGSERANPQVWQPDSPSEASSPVAEVTALRQASTSTRSRH